MPNRLAWVSPVATSARNLIAILGFFFIVMFVLVVMHLKFVLREAQTMSGTRSRLPHNVPSEAT